MRQILHLIDPAGFAPSREDRQRVLKPQERFPLAKAWGTAYHRSCLVNRLWVPSVMWSQAPAGQWTATRLRKFGGCLWIRSIQCVCAGRSNPRQTSKRVANSGKGESIAIERMTHCGSPRDSFWSSRLLLAVQVALADRLEQQFAGRYDVLADALGRTFEYNLIPFPPVHENRSGSPLRTLCGDQRDLRTGKDAQFANQ